MFGVDGIFYALGAAVIVALVAFFKGRVDGAKLERAKQDRARLKSIKDKKEKDDEVAGLDPDKLSGRFDRWVRDE